MHVYNILEVITLYRHGDETSGTQGLGEGRGKWLWHEGSYTHTHTYVKIGEICIRYADYIYINSWL